jgi:hypothetical protein
MNNQKNVLKKQKGLLEYFLPLYKKVIFAHARKNHHS